MANIHCPYCDRDFEIHELAVVDRSAKLPLILVDPKFTGVEIVRQYKDILLKDGWIREVK